MATVQIGTALNIGGQTDRTGFIVIEEESDVDVRMEEVENEDGHIVTLLVYEKHPILILTLLATGSTDFSAFPKGAMSTFTGLTDYFVQDCKVVKSKGAMKGTVTLINYENIT